MNKISPLINLSQLDIQSRLPIVISFSQSLQKGTIIFKYIRIYNIFEKLSPLLSFSLLPSCFYLSLFHTAKGAVLVWRSSPSESQSAKETATADTARTCQPVIVPRCNCRSGPTFISRESENSCPIAPNREVKFHREINCRPPLACVCLHLLKK